jgi:hypothetical protein
MGDILDSKEVRRFVGGAVKAGRIEYVNGRTGGTEKKMRNDWLS